MLKGPHRLNRLPKSLRVRGSFRGIPVHTRCIHVVCYLYVCKLQGSDSRLEKRQSIKEDRVNAGKWTTVSLDPSRTWDEEEESGRGRRD